MVSERKRAANRANASKSTGPKTARGKEKASRNSIKHGLLSQRTPVLPFEDEFEYRTISDAMMRDFAPIGIVQREVVTRIVQINWKIRRIPAIEAALLEDSFDDISEQFERGKERGDYEEDAVIEPVTAAKVIATQFALNGDRPYERLEIYGMRLQRSFISACRELAKLKKETAGEELPVLNQFLYLKEDSVRMERKLEAMDGDSCGSAGLRRAQSSRVSPVPGREDPRQEHGQDARGTEDRNASGPNEATAEANSRPGQTLSRSAATANPIAKAAATTVKAMLPPKDWPKDKVWPYWEHYPWK